MSTEVKPSSERKCTNVPALAFAIVFIAITVILVAYCGLVATPRNTILDPDDPDHLMDNCGNICGQLNPPNITGCGDPDKTRLPKLLIKDEEHDHDDDDDDYLDDDHYRRHNIKSECVRECPRGYLEKSNTCTEFSSDTKFSNIFKSTWYHIIIICFIAFIFSYVFLILFRHAAKYVIWVINIGCLVVVFGLALLFLFQGDIVGGAFFGIIGAVLVGLLYYFRKRIVLVAKLFKEASKALIDVPAIMFEPILTFISLLISFLIFASFFIIISLADQKNPVTTAAHIFNIISFTFITQFIIGCQNFIIAGTITRWYFTRDKTKLRKPIKKSFSHLFKFHLGSVCLGAILITFAKIIKNITAQLNRSARDRRNLIAALLATCCSCLFEMIEKLLSFLIRNAYIIIAKEGTPFCDSGRRACRLLMDNITDVIALNHFGDFVLMVCRVLIMLIAQFVGLVMLTKTTENPDHIQVPYIIGSILAFLIAHCFVMVFEMTVDTIFISFCIDLEENDGQTKPYYMSESLKRIIMAMKAEKGGVLYFGPKGGSGMYDGSAIPMLESQQPPLYPNIGHTGSNSQPPQGYPPQQMAPYVQQPMLPQPGYPPVQSYPEKY
ncbi:choline transporter-like protein 1 [Chironomus tepperi]|uniref:choline transporter-like protein 1 n=1 Tax=Chironomus tepperi TaxID=113505 RepID=UPI00391F8126